MLERIYKIFDENRDRIFLIDEITKRELTYEELFQLSKGFSSYLKSIDVKTGDFVAICLENSLEFVVIYFGLLLHGAIAVPLNPTLGSALIEQNYNSSGARILFSSEDVVNANNLDIEKKQIKFVKKGCLDNASFDSLKAEYLGGFEKNDSFEDNDLILIFTSGTTEKPKGVRHTYKSLLSNGQLFINKMALNDTSRFINYLPLSYLGGYYNLLLIPFLSQGSVVLTEPFGPKVIMGFWKTLELNHINTVWFVPTIMKMLFIADKGQNGIEYCQNTNSMKFLAGTAPLDKTFKIKFEERYGVTVHENYGLSETLFITTNVPGKSTYAGVGTLMDDVKVKIMDGNNQEAFGEKEGEIFVNTPFLMKNYLENPISDEEKIWFPTGDIGKLSSEGELLITGRKKDLIIRGGINISPLAIESVVRQNSLVQECAVIGIEDDIMGESIICVIKKDDNTDFDSLTKSIHESISSKLPTMYLPSKYLNLSEFPFTSSGKIQKGKIKSWVIDQMQQMNNMNQYSGSKRVQNGGTYFQASTSIKNVIQATSIRYNNMVYEMKEKGIDVTVLSLGEAFFDIPLHDFNALEFPAIYHYSHSRGIIGLRRKLAEYYECEYEVTFNPEKEIIITAGSKAAIYMALYAIVNPKDEVIVHEPAWVSYSEQVKLCHAIPVMVPHTVSVFEFEKYITNRTKVIIINNPNNPSGKIYTLEELAYLSNLAKKYRLFILSDEAYSDFVVDTDKFVSIANIDKKLDHSIICNSMSKNFGMSGWRIGYVISNASIIDQILKLQQHIITCPPTILQMYLEKYFDEVIANTKPQILEVVLKRQKIAEYIEKKGLKCLEGTATFYFFLSIDPSKLSSEDFCTELLQDFHICAVPGIGYGETCDRHIRISIGSESIERICLALDKIVDLIKETSK